MTRQTWKSNAEFLYSTIGYCVGLGNIWRFPYLCAESGGGSFLLPYFLMTLFLGIPLFYLEVGIGQALKAGPAEAFAKLIPKMYGIGLASIVLTFLLCSYYCVVISWSMVIVYDTFLASTEKISTNYSQDFSRNYWENDILQNSKTEILFCLCLTWLLIYLTIHRGVSIASKIAKYTVMLPYVILFVKKINLY